MQMNNYFNLKKSKLLLLTFLTLTVGTSPVWAQKSMPYSYGFEQNGKSANARETFGQNRKSANARGGAECDNCPNAKQTERLESPLDRCPGTYRRDSQRHHTHIGHRQLERQWRQL